MAKANLLQAEFEDQSLLFQHTQDQLATDMMTFVAGERQYAQWVFKVCFLNDCSVYAGGGVYDSTENCLDYPWSIFWLYSRPHESLHTS